MTFQSGQHRFDLSLVIVTAKKPEKFLQNLRSPMSSIDRKMSSRAKDVLPKLYEEFCKNSAQNLKLKFSETLPNLICEFCFTKSTLNSFPVILSKGVPRNSHVDIRYAIVWWQLLWKALGIGHSIGKEK